MIWDNIRFSARDVIRIVANVVTATAFILIMKSDIKSLVAGQIRIEQKQDKAEENSANYQAKTTVELTELKVRISILEQKVNNLEIYQHERH